MPRSFVQNLIASPFLRNVSVLTLGTLIAQLIPFLVLPLYTRLFNPEIFALQALLQVGMLFFAPLATGYYEWAMPSARHPREARALATVSVVMAAALCLLATAILLLFHARIALAFHLEALGGWIYAYPLIIFATAMSSVANYWLVRMGRFSRQATNRMVLTASVAIIALVLGGLGYRQGLLVGFVGGAVIGGVWAMAQAWHAGLRMEWKLPPRYFWQIFKTYREFPLFGSIPSAINNLAAQVPLLIITATYTLSIAGHYAVARALLSSGVGLISVAVGQVLLKQFSDRLHAGQPLWPYYRMVSLWVCATGLGLTLAVYAIGPWFFRTYLGAGWSDSAEIIRMLSLNLLFWLLGPAMAMAVVAIRKLRMIALWQLLYGTMAIALLLFRDLPFHDFMHRVVLVEAIAYALYFALMSWTVWRYDQRLKSA